MKKLVTFLVLALASFALVACGGDDDSDTTATSGGAESTTEAGGEAGGQANAGGGGGAASSSVSFEADPAGDLAYTTTSAEAEAGKVTIEFDNPQALSHDVRIEDSSGKDLGGTEVIADGSDSAVVDLKPGTYTFYCSIPGHREGGMEGTLTVK